jgi:hypothetical protein
LVAAERGMSEWEHNPPETLTGGVPWKVTLEADGCLCVSMESDDGLTFTLRVASETVLELGNAIRRNEVRRVLEQQKGGAR